MGLVCCQEFNVKSCPLVLILTCYSPRRNNSWIECSEVDVVTYNGLCGALARSPSVLSPHSPICWECTGWGSHPQLTLSLSSALNLWKLSHTRYSPSWGQPSCNDWCEGIDLASLLQLRQLRRVTLAPDLLMESAKVPVIIAS